MKFYIKLFLATIVSVVTIATIQAEKHKLKFDNLFIEILHNDAIMLTDNKQSATVFHLVKIPTEGIGATSFHIKHDSKFLAATATTLILVQTPDDAQGNTTWVRPTSQEVIYNNKHHGNIHLTGAK